MAVPIDKLGPAQLRLFRGAELAIDPTFAKAKRIRLDATSWIDHVPDWLTCDDLLLNTLASVPQWEQRQRWMFTKFVDEPRLTAEYPNLYDTPIPMLASIGHALSRHYSVRFDTAWLNLYRDQRDSTGFHADRPANKLEQATIPVLSLGETRRFQLRPTSGGSSTTLVVAGGDLIVMGGRCQRDWVHAVPKETRRAGVRISVNFGSGPQLRKEESD